ncbi:hypothetical protein PROFUN_16732, partial [Planoprotostelium fungivorum]
ASLIARILLILKIVCYRYCSMKIFHKEPTSKRLVTSQQGLVLQETE